MQRIAKQVPAAMDTHARVELLLEKVFSTRSVQRDYKEDNWSKYSSVARKPQFRVDLNTEAEE
jgi:hypothetical protein